jgi:hypothetical protein
MHKLLFVHTQEHQYLTSINKLVYFNNQKLQANRKCFTVMEGYE